MYFGFSDLEDFWDDLPVSRLKYNALENFPDDFLEVFNQMTTSWKSSGLTGSLLTKPPFHNRAEHFGFLDLEDFWDDLPVSRLKYNVLDDFLEVVWTSRRSSGLPGGRLDFQEVVWTSRRSSGLPGGRLDFQEVIWTSWKSSGLPGSLLPYQVESKLFFVDE
ncbi:hypothetical protein YC2023_076355 [Brassica napus]